MTTSAYCPRCNWVEETSLHALRECLYVVSICQATLSHNRRKKIFRLRNCEWLIDNLSKHNEWEIWFGVTIHFLWYLWNKFIFEGKTISIVEAVGSINVRVHKVLNIVE
ncbi:Putative ribonuclease H protein [Arachis hypogaea]|nr:Putative ribonuclease H protein [Arachis hypogaea]